MSFALGLPLVLEVGIGNLGNGGSSSPNEEVDERAECERLRNWEEATSEEVRMNESSCSGVDQ